MGWEQGWHFITFESIFDEIRERDRDHIVAKKENDNE